MKPIALCLILALGACTDTSKPEDTDTDAAVDTDTPTDTSPATDSADTGDAGGPALTTCDDAPRPAEADPFVTSQQFPFADAPDPEYGTIRDGVYKFASSRRYGPMSGSGGTKALLVIQAGVTRWVFARSLEGGTDTCNQGTIDTDGTKFNLMVSESTSFSENWGYTATDNGLDLFFSNDPTTQVNIAGYQRISD